MDKVKTQEVTEVRYLSEGCLIGLKSKCALDKSADLNRSSTAFHGGWNSVGDEGAAGSLEDCRTVQAVTPFFNTIFITRRGVKSSLVLSCRPVRMEVFLILSLETFT